jgi:hypothetical protein
MESDLRVFVIGFNKCATKAFHQFFSYNGLKSVHWENNVLAQDMWAQITGGKDPTGLHPGVQVFSDMECVTDLDLPPIEIYLHFRELYNWHPDAKFILNTRAVDAWIISRIYHMDGRYLDAWKHHYATRDVFDVIDRWRQSWAEHHAAVREFFADKPDSLLEFDVDHDAPAKLCRHFEGVLSLDVKYFQVIREGKKTPSWWGVDAGEIVAAQNAVLSIDPNHARAHGILSLVAEHQGERDRSLYHADMAYKLMPEIPEFEANLKRLLQ